MNIRLRRPPYGRIQAIAEVGCESFVGQGDTISEALEKLQECLEDWGIIQSYDISDTITSTIKG